MRYSEEPVSSPPHRTAQTYSPYAALLSASYHGLCDLSTGSTFGHGPVSDPVVSEEPEPPMELRRTPPLPAEASKAPRPHQMAAHTLLDPQPHIRQAPMRVPDPKVVHPPPEDRVDRRRNTSLSFPSNAVRYVSCGATCALQTPRRERTRRKSNPRNPKVSP